MKDTEIVKIRVPNYIAEFMRERMTSADIVEVLARGYMQDEASMNKEAPAPKKPVLQVANELIGGQRQNDYGGKLQNFSQIAMLWTGSFAHKLMPGQAFTPEDVAIGMMQVKIARLAKSPDHADSLIDVAGYTGCYEAVQNERADPENYPLRGATVDAGAERRK